MPPALPINGGSDAGMVLINHVASRLHVRSTFQIL
jgi:hypothetical protein